MTHSRRRFLSIAAAGVALPGAAVAREWQGRAFGAEVSITLHGPRDVTAAALEEARGVIVETERLFSLYDPASALVQLNKAGILRGPGPVFLDLMQAANRAFDLTGGLFDPSVQPLWAALAEGRDPASAERSIGWQHVRFDSTLVTLGPAQALTFNGIAQGFATDRVTEVLIAHGLTRTLVNIGEHRGIGGPWTLGINDPVQGFLGHRRLTDSAIATSSPTATPLGQDGHILHAHARPKWSTVSVEAGNATLADSLSTAMVLADRNQIERIKARAGLRRVTLVDFDGDLVTL